MIGSYFFLYLHSPENVGLFFFFPIIIIIIPLSLDRFFEQNPN